MNITTNGFIGYGATAQIARSMIYTLPYPDRSNALFQSEYPVDASRNANGVVVGQRVGNRVDKQNMSWSLIETNKWWAFNNFINNNFFFYVHYFNFNIGKWQTKKFYHGSPECNPMNIDTTNGKPMWLENAKVNIIDKGEGVIND